MNSMVMPTSVSRTSVRSGLFKDFSLAFMFPGCGCIPVFSTVGPVPLRVERDDMAVIPEVVPEVCAGRFRHSLAVPSLR